MLSFLCTSQLSEEDHNALVKTMGGTTLRDYRQRGRYEFTRLNNIPTIYLIGVTTGQSTITRLFPCWAAILGLEGARLIGVDLPLQAPMEQYRESVSYIKYDPLSLGALITTHKVDLFNAAEDLLDTLDPYARLCREVDCISKRDGHLVAHSMDPLGSRRALQAILCPHYWAGVVAMCSAWEQLGRGPQSPSIRSHRLISRIGRNGLSSSTSTITDWAGCALEWRN